MFGFLVRFPSLLLCRQFTGARFCAVGVELLFVASIFGISGVLLFRLFIRLADLAVFPSSRFHLKVIDSR